MQFVRHHLAPGVCNPIAALTILVELSPMPALVEEVPEDVEELRDERHINQAVIWDITMFLWPMFYGLCSMSKRRNKVVYLHWDLRLQFC